ncbi:helix-turn-helix domain-containing protein [Chloroflexota bacterium]
MTVREVALLLHVHPNTLRRWSESGIIKAYRISSRGARRFTKEDILKFLSELESEKCNPKQVQVARR